MAFVQRKNKKDKIVFEESSIDKSSDSETLRKSQKLKKRDDLKREVKTYNDMTIEVLNILESQGIDIYDPNRTGGMYQRREGVNELQEKNIIQRISSLALNFSVNPRHFMIISIQAVSS